MDIDASRAVLFAGLAAYVAIRGVYQIRARAAGPAKSDLSTPQDRLLVLLVVAGQVVLPLAFLLTPWLGRFSYPPLPGAAWIGAALWVAGLLLFWRSHADLGRNWSVTLELQHGHQLVSHGVYRRVRHPMYTSFLVLGAAQAVLLPNLVSGPAGLVATLVLCAVRVPREEAMLVACFGQQYRAYMQTTGSVLPQLFAR